VQRKINVHGEESQKNSKMNKTEIVVAKGAVPIPAGPGIYLEKQLVKMRFSKETEGLLTPLMRKEVDFWLEVLPKMFPDGKITEGVKYTLHLTFNHIFNYDVIPTQQFFRGNICGKEQIVFFFVPLFE